MLFSQGTKGYDAPAQYDPSHEPLSQKRIDEIPLEEDDRLFMDGYVNVQRPNHASQQSLATKRPLIPTTTTTDIAKRQRTAAQQQQPSSSLRRMPDYLPEEMNKGYGDMPRSTALNDMYRRINELEKIKQDYDCLVALRFTEPERIYKAYVAAESKQLEAADNYVKGVEEELARITRENQELKEKLQHSKANRELVNQVDELNQELTTISAQNETLKKAEKESKQAMEMYQNLSGLSITGVRSIMEGDLYTCVQTGKRGTIHFKLLCEKPGNDVRYIPLLDKKKDAQLLSLLPGYLTTEIVFQKDKVHVFYSKLRNVLDNLNTTA
ncbi:hypothetical protein LRAMOSA06032 [Lichtheimia ramosa]|uniref:Monopolin complex subunit Csm1/Pcs1 C-terminal domain-containing protein n=1 Tax=Lichtheimia ramosa TaxID=688394 RepID=A0A077X3J9_9FUNG|nr:hypothetical protein LRAMOSA06032 [Lichtheimia ramosa]